MASSAASSFSSSFTQQWRYDVFLSFRGEDTRKNFTSHLYKELLQKGIITFKDNNELPKGESVPQYLPKAIQDSRISVVIFSENYAASTWCLNELVKIFECKNAGTQIVLPIFYDVNPYEVRQQDGKFGEPFIEYEKIFKDNIEKVQEWRLASTEVANLAGWHLGDRDESEFIQDIVEDILRQLRRTSHHSIAKDFVGMESRLEKMKGYLDLEQLSKVRIIGICGMGGIGKTTIASVVYKDIRCQFEGSCFLGNVRESFEKYGIVSLQKQLLSATLMYDGVQVYDVYRGTDEIRDRLCCKKILVILDDVDQLEQLELLIGKRDEHWFGTGSRIIITTRDVHLLKKYGTDEIYLVQGLSHGESFKLFCSKAFKSNYPKEEYVEPSNEFVKYSSGLPLALVVLGSSLFGKGVREWNSTLRRLKEIPNEKILSKLQLSYDGLDKILQEMFLDIACFFKGMDEEYVVKVLESCGFFPDSGIGELIDKSLITVSGFVEMHDLVQEMGREIVRRESNENPGLHSRIWFDKDLYYIQVKNMETKQVKAIVLHSWKLEEHLNAKVFSKMKELRLLILRDVPTSQEVEYLSNELRYLEWHECPCKTFPSNFQPDKLVELHMQCSRIEQLWRRSIKPIKLLKIIDLSYSKNLLKTPNFQEVPNLEELNLEGCESLREIHQSIGVLKRLVFLNLKNCRNLVTLPNSMFNLKSLKTLILRGCSKLMKLPDSSGDMTCMEEFSATGFGMQQLELAKRWGFHLLSWLLPWTWKNPHPISIVFPSLSALPFLNNLNLSYCDLPEGAIPSDLTGFPFLEHLDLSGNNFESLPSSISHLSHLRSLELSNCKRLQLLPDLPSTIITLRVNNCTSLESLPNLHEKHNNPLAILMEFSNCSKLNDYQGNINVAFTWLKSHLLFLLESRWLLSSRHARYCPKKGYFLDDSPLLFFLDISMRFPGSEIPKWFNHQSFNSPLRIRLSACEKWWNIAGFVICVAISSKTVYQGPELCKFTIYKKRKEVWESYFSLKVPSNVRLTSDHLHIFSVANPIPIDPYEEESTAEVELTFREYIIKRCGIRIVHLKEIKELIQTNEPLNPFENCQENSYSGEEDDDPVRGDFLWKTIPIENWRIEYWGSYLQLIYTSGREDFVWTSIKIESWGIEYWGSYGRMVTLEGSIWKDRDWEKEWQNGSPGGMYLGVRIC